MTVCITESNNVRDKHNNRSNTMDEESNVLIDINACCLNFWSEGGVLYDVIIICCLC